MAQTRNPAPANRLLERLPEADRQRFLARTRPTPLEFESVLYEARAAIDYAWFPISGVTSALTIMNDGSAIEVATVGNEGMLGMAALFGPATSPLRVIPAKPPVRVRLPSAPRE